MGRGGPEYAGATAYQRYRGLDGARPVRPGAGPGGCHPGGTAAGRGHHAGHRDQPGSHAGVAGRGRGAAVSGRRAVTIRHEVTGTLEAVTALRAGGWGSSAHADLVVARDGLERLMIPGTSLAGALRSWLGSVTAASGGALFDQA